MKGRTDELLRVIVLLHACRLPCALQQSGIAPAKFVPAPWGRSPAPRTRLAQHRSRDDSVLNRLSEEETLSRMSYWSVRDQPIPPTDKYTLFTVDTGGPNNMRIGWEMTGLVAQATQRTLVLPPASMMYLLDYPIDIMPRWPSDVPAESTKTAVEDLINLRQLKTYLPTLTWEEFVNKTGLTWETAVAESHAVAAEDTCDMSAYRNITGRILYMTGDGPRREGFGCGEWWLRGGPRRMRRGVPGGFRAEISEDGWSLLKHGFVWHADAFAIASKVVNALGIFEYSALHARYGDFQEAQTAPTDIMDSMHGLLKLGNKLYIASDDPAAIRSLTRMQDFNVVTLDDVLEGELKQTQAGYTSERWFKLLGLVEELICTYAKVFVGTSRSSFSGHIHRMRLHAQAPVTRVLMHGSDPEGMYDNATVSDVTVDIAAWESAGKLRTLELTSPLKGDQFIQHGTPELAVRRN